MIGRQAVKSLMEWTPISSRTITVRSYAGYRGVAMKRRGEKDQFFRWYDSNKNDITIIIGDLNAKVGSESNGYNRIMGIHGLCFQNDNGERLCEFCPTNGLVITETLYLQMYICDWKSEKPF